MSEATVITLIVRYGPWGLAAALVASIVTVARLLISKGYGVKIDIGPRPKS